MIATATGGVLVMLASCALPFGEQPPKPAAHVDYLAGFPTGEAQRWVVCSRNHGDRFAAFLCPSGSPPPPITSLADLQAALWIDPAQAPFAMTAHSTASTAKSTSVLNPRAVFYPVPGSPDPYLLLGFARGDGFAEVIAFDPTTNQPNFYFVRYRLDCDPHCSNAERFGPASESGWSSVSVYDDQDLKNTVLDCLMCHTPAGAGTRRILRMQELSSPWTHWLQRGTASEVLLDEFLAAHVGEPYAGIPAARIETSNPGGLEFFLRQKEHGDQPNEYPSAQIEGEGPRGPAWQSLHAAAVAGEAISPPYWAVSPFDPAKVADAAERYRGVQAGTRPASDMPDLTDLFLESAYPDLGFTAAVEATTGTAIVRHRCGTCHNGKFPGISRNNFDVNDFPDALAPEMKERVRERLRLPATSRLRMPPLLFSELTEEHIAKIEAEMGFGVAP